MSAQALLKTPLEPLHAKLGAKMVEFAGYEMPLHYPGGILAEHRHCRQEAALFDVSHMGQIRLSDDAGGAEAARALESLVPADIVGLAPGQQRYTFFTNASGGILDDLMVLRRHSDLLLVVNAACKEKDLRHLHTNIGLRCHAQPLADHALLALQGPKCDVLSGLDPGVAKLTFLSGGWFKLDGIESYVTRSGYTGEDGFEISVPADAAIVLAGKLLDRPEVRMAGLGARDTLRLEAGLCLYGHDIDERTTPVEAGLAWAIPKVRRPGGARAGRYPGAPVIESQLATGPMAKRVGLVGLERVPVREGSKIFDARGHTLGRVTSGTVGPTVDKPIAMAYLANNHALNSHEVYAEVRDKRLPMRVAPLPFVPHRYARQ